MLWWPLSLGCLHIPCPHTMGGGAGRVLWGPLSLGCLQAAASTPIQPIPYCPSLAIRSCSQGSGAIAHITGSPGTPRAENPAFSTVQVKTEQGTLREKEFVWMQPDYVRITHVQGACVCACTQVCPRTCV